MTTPSIRITNDDWGQIRDAIRISNRTEKQQNAVDKFCDMMDETVAWLNSPEVLKFVGESNVEDHG